MRMEWEKLRRANKQREQAQVAKPEKTTGAQTHIKRDPVKNYTDAQILDWAKALGL